MENISNTGEPLDRSREGVIKAWFDYNAETGEITWKEWVSPEWYKYKSRHRTFIQDRAGMSVKFYRNSDGHLMITAGGIDNIYAHQIAWVLTYGKMPKHHIDHIDGNPKNNRIENLRDVPNKINLRNQKMACNNTSGVTGVYWHKRAQKWQAQIKVDGKYKYLGTYNTVEEAAKARQRFVCENSHLGFTDRHGKTLEIFESDENQKESK